MYNSLILPITNKGAIYAGFAPRANNMWLWCRDLLRLDCDGVTFDILSQKHVAFWEVRLLLSRLVPDIPYFYLFSRVLILANWKKNLRN